jgi:hypothetical protein
MDFSEQQPTTFEEAERRYAELKRRHDAGEIDEEHFDTERRRLMVQDDEGRWWAKSRKSGEWNYHDGSGWVAGSPPGYQPPRASPIESMPAHQSQPRHYEQSLSTQTARFRGEWRRGLPRSVIIAVGVAGTALVMVGIIVWVLVPYLRGEAAPSEQGGAMGSKQSVPAPGYQLVRDDSGNLGVEIPSEWKVLTGKDSESGPGSGPESSWSAFEGKNVGSSITASADLYAWHNTPSPVTPGIYIAASRGLAQRYADDELVVSGPNNLSKGCQAGPRQDFDRSSYPGKTQTWSCEGGTYLTLAAAPESRECVVLAQIGMYSEADRKSAEHMLNTFEVDCSKID